MDGLTKNQKRILESITNTQIELYKKKLKLEERLNKFKLKYPEKVPKFVCLDWLGIWLSFGTEKTYQLIHPEREPEICEDCGCELGWEN